MKIYTDNCTGHIMTKRMTPYFKQQGHKFYEDPRGCDVQLAFVRYGWQGKLPKVLRLDGIYYDAATPWRERNGGISQSHAISDAVIYQSNYSKMLCEALLLPRNSKAKSSVIFNGIEPDWCGSHMTHEGFNIVVVGKHRRHKRLKEIIDVFTSFYETHRDAKLHVFGLLHDNKVVKHPGITYYGMVDRSKMVDVFRVSDCSIHLSKRDSCPNSVVETLGAGIPNITTDNCGGATEMCELTPGCYIIGGDGLYDDVSPVPHYGEAWNVLPRNVFHGVIHALEEVYNTRPRVILPNDLHIKTVSDKYIKTLLGVL